MTDAVIGGTPRDKPPTWAVHRRVPADVEVEGEGQLADRLHQCKAPVLLLVGSVPHPSEVTGDQREMLRTRIPKYRTESVRGSGQYIQEEQPAAVLAALARLEQVSR